jgi:aspartate oxidase
MLEVFTKFIIIGIALRRVMWSYVGIVRKESRLLEVREGSVEVRKERDDMVDTFKMSPNIHAWETLPSSLS